jgi:hypothetical protein
MQLESAGRRLQTQQARPVTTRSRLSFPTNLVEKVGLENDWDKAAPPSTCSLFFEKARRGTATGNKPPRSPRPTGPDRTDGDRGAGATPAGAATPPPEERGAPHPRSGTGGAHGGEEAGLLGCVEKAQWGCPLPAVSSSGRCNTSLIVGH